MFAERSCDVNHDTDKPWITARSAAPYVPRKVAAKRARRAERERVLHDARWGAGKPLDLSPEEATELATARRKARNKRKPAAAPVQKLTVYSVTTRVRPLRAQYAHGYPVDDPRRASDVEVQRAPRLPSKRAISVLHVHVVTAHDLAKHGMLPGFIGAATQAEAERIAVERRYRAERSKARRAA